MSSLEATLRCPRCGNENSSDSFSCSFCGKRLRIEKIENVSIFKRIEKEWIRPEPFYMNIYWLFLRPNYAFWDINHRRRSAPGYIIIFLNSLLWGLMGIAFLSHYTFTPFSTTLFFYVLYFFIVFFILGFIFQMLLFTILIWFFTKGANYAVDFSSRMESRFGGEKEMKKKELEKSQMSPFSIYKGGTLLQKQQAHKYKMLYCAFAPYLLINVIKIFIIIIAFPTVRVKIEGGAADPSLFQGMFNSPVWAVLDVIDALTLAIWVPILMAIGIRELSNSSTFRVLISSFAIGIITSIFVYWLRPTLFG